VKIFARTVATCVVALGAGVAIAACGDDDSDSKSDKPESISIGVTQEGKGKFGLTAPKSVKAGLVEISLKAPPGKVSHDVQLVKVEGNHSVEEVLAFIAKEGAPTPKWLFAAGGVGQTKGGETGSATQELGPGKYYILDTGEPEGENVKSYAEQGATATLEVTGESSKAELPTSDAKITAKDYTFTTSGLKAGKNTIQFDNAGKELHHAIAFPYKKGTTLAAVKKAFTSDGPPSGPPPVDFENVSSTAVLEGGTKQVTQLDLKSGKYALVCFVSDRRGGPPHVAKGMIVETNVP